MRGALVFFAAFLALAEGRLIKLALPHALKPEETVWLQVKTGTLARGEEIEVRTESGRLLGTVSPFGARAAKQPSVYTVPVPSDAIADGSVSVRLFIGKDRREPTKEEVPAVTLRIGPAARGRQ